jgi:hypothetical protein
MLCRSDGRSLLTNNTPSSTTPPASSPHTQHNELQPNLRMHANDDVVYLCTMRHSEGTSASPIDTSSVDYNRVIRHSQRRHQSRAVVRPSSIRSSRRKHNNRHITASKTKPRWSVPYEVRNKCVRLGWTAKDIGGEHQRVFGLFDAAGRFCRRVGTESPSSKSISHMDIKYCESLSGLAANEVRNKVLEHLMGKCGPTLGPGEI